MLFYNNTWESPNREESEEDYKHTKCIPIILSYDLQTDMLLKCYLLKPLLWVINVLSLTFMFHRRFQVQEYFNL